MTQQVAHWVHFVLTVLLFMLNILLTQIISRKDLVARLRYIGHEMVFLSIGIAASRIFIIGLPIVFLSVFIYLVIWAITLYLTQQVIDATKVLVPQLGCTIALGFVSVYLSASGLLEHSISAYLKNVG